MRRALRTVAGALLVAALPMAAVAAELVIGQVAQTGDPSSVGAQMQRGIALYLDAVNRSGGVNGRTLRLVAKNRSGDAADGVRKVRELMAEAHPIALVGLMGTGAMEALVKDKLLEEEGVPVVGIRTGATALHEPVHPWLFHTRASYRAEVDKIAQHLATIGVRRVALLHESSPFGKEVQDLAEAAFARAKLAMVSRVAVDPQNTDMRPAAEQIAKAAPEAVLTALASPATADVYLALRGAGVSAHVIALSTTDGTQVVKRIGQFHAHGLGIAQVVPDPENRSVQVAREFQRDLREARAPAADLNQAALEGYIAAKVLVEGLRRAGPNPTRANLRSALESLHAYDVGGPVIALSPSSHSGSQYVDIAILNRNGRMLR